MLSAVIRWYLQTPVSLSGVSLALPSGVVIDGNGTTDIILRFHRWRDLCRLAFDPSIALAEAYANDSITIENGDIYAVLYHLNKAVVYRNAPILMKGFIRLCLMFAPVFQGWRAAISQRNVRFHYDIGNELYRLFLDEDWQYSCAYFDEGGISLDEAQRRKKQHIARKLMLDKNCSVLDIGSGWGGMALYLGTQARSVKGITLSREQIEFAKARVNKEEANKEKSNKEISNGSANVSFDFKDYRAEDGQFDRIVSVGMLEHVGKNHYTAYYNSVDRCLKPDGVALIHTIAKVKPSPMNRFITKYIFPGGYLSTLQEHCSALDKTGLVIADVEVWFWHYAETLRHWRQRFMANRAAAVALKGERFAKIWEFYLAGCEAGFRNGDICVYQIQLYKYGRKPHANRRYIYP